MDTTIWVSLITTGGGIVIAFICAWATSGRAVAAAVAPLNTEIARLREMVIELGGDPDEE